MNCKEFKRWLKKQGCIFDERRGKGRHTGTVAAIKKQLGLK